MELERYYALWYVSSITLSETTIKGRPDFEDVVFEQNNSGP